MTGHLNNHFIAKINLQQSIGEINQQIGQHLIQLLLKLRGLLFTGPPSTVAETARFEQGTQI